MGALFAGTLVASRFFLLEREFRVRIMHAVLGLPSHIVYYIKLYYSTAQTIMSTLLA